MKSFTIDHSKTCTWLNRFITYFSNYFFELFGLEHADVAINVRSTRMNILYTTLSADTACNIYDIYIQSVNHFVCYCNILSFDFNSLHSVCFRLNHNVRNDSFVQFKCTRTGHNGWKWFWSAHHWKWWDFILTFQEPSKSRNASSKPLRSNNFLSVHVCMCACNANARHMALGFDHLVLCVCDDDGFILRICQIQCKTAVITFHVYALYIYMIETKSSECVPPSKWIRFQAIQIVYFYSLLQRAL